MDFWISALVFLGSALMVYNIVRYARFTREMCWMGRSFRNCLALFTPLVLLVLFLAGYLVEGLFGDPTPVVGAILFGGSVFVFIILRLLYFIIDRVKENEHLQTELSDARQASEAKSIFLSNMSHDIRTPMNAILGYTHLARQPETTEAQMRGFLEKINASGQHLLALINDVLEMSRIESGKIDLEETRTDLGEVLDDVRDMFATQMESKRIAYRVDAAQVEDRWVLCDRNRLNRILLNLISNAYKFTPEGGSVSVALRQTGSTDGRGVYELRVKDTGIGMSPEFAARVFEAFERERSSTVSGIQGTGLGMAITKNLVDLMGGGIRVETAPGKGTEFIITLDFPLTEAASAPARAVNAAESATETLGGRLLLAEDNPVNREIATLVLQQLGYEIDTVENGRLAVERVSEAAPGTYRAVLMDVQMPEMDGYQATRAIRALTDARRAKIPVIAMTANAFSEDILTEQEAGMNAHISKPLDVDQLAGTLADLFGRQEKP